MIISTHLAICVGCMTSDFKIPPFFKHSYFCVCFQLGKGDGHIKKGNFYINCFVFQIGESECHGNMQNKNIHKM